jgi:hypothetical protein
MLMSARVLGWYAQAVYGAFMPVAAFCTLEWRLKQRWVKETLEGQLVYGPLCWRQSQPKCSKLVTAVQDLFSWLLVTAVCWVLLWEVVTWIVPQLPVMPCQTCEDTGTCLPIEFDHLTAHVRFSTVQLQLCVLVACLGSIRSNMQQLLGHVVLRVFCSGKRTLHFMLSVVQQDNLRHIPQNWHSLLTQLPTR